MSTDLPPLPDTEACPFCAMRLVPDQRRNTGAAHPRNAECFLSGYFFGASRLPSWNKRRAAPAAGPVKAIAIGPAKINAPTGAAPHMVVKDNIPTFNDQGEGKPVDASFLNALVHYYEGLKNG